MKRAPLTVNINMEVPLPPSRQAPTCYGFQLGSRSASFSPADDTVRLAVRQAQLSDRLNDLSDSQCTFRQQCSEECTCCKSVLVPVLCQTAGVPSDGNVRKNAPAASLSLCRPCGVAPPPSGAASAAAAGWLPRGARPKSPGHGPSPAELAAGTSSPRSFRQYVSATIT